MIKIDLITGFLGSGKTTFIKRYASYLTGEGLRVAILENDYGAVNVDMLLLRELEEAGCELEMIAGGCDYDCHVRRFRTKLISMAMRGFDRVLVEPSGIFDTDEFFDLLHDEPIDRFYEAGSVIGIVDAGLPDGLSRESDYFLVSQLSNAGTVVMSHTAGAGRDRIRGTIRHINRAMASFGCERTFSEEEVLTKSWDDFGEADFRRFAAAGIRPADYVKMRVADDNGFMTLYFLKMPLTLAELKALTEELFAAPPEYGGVFRVKGFHREGGQWYELNAVRGEISLKECAEGQEVFLVIGEHLRQEEIARRVIPGELRQDVWHNGQVYTGP